MRTAAVGSSQARLNRQDTVEENDRTERKETVKQREQTNKPDSGSPELTPKLAGCLAMKRMRIYISNEVFSPEAGSSREKGMNANSG